MARLNRVFPLKRGDTKPLLSVALLDAAGAAVDLSLGDPTVKLQIGIASGREKVSIAGGGRSVKTKEMEAADSCCSPGKFSG